MRDFYGRLRSMAGHQRPLAVRWAGSVAQQRPAAASDRFMQISTLLSEHRDEQDNTLAVLGKPMTPNGLTSSMRCTAGSMQRNENFRQIPTAPVLSEVRLFEVREAASQRAWEPYKVVRPAHRGRT
jgi:hypothetical protein